jgi:hypothetical protein
MRFADPAIALCVALLALAGTPAVAQTAQPPAPTTAAPATAAAAPSTAPAAAGDSDAAARHAKLTGCIKDAKAKKLVGADKKAYIKNCVAAP